MHEALNQAKLAMLFRREFELCNVRKGETLVLLSDLGARRDYVAAAFAAAEDFGADVYEMCVNAMPSWTKVGVETVGRCKGTLEAIKSADMLVCPTSRCSRVAEGGARRRHARADGHRRAGRARNADVSAGPQGGRVLRRRAARARQDMRITRPGGTDLTRKAAANTRHDPVRLCRAPGRFDHWGAGRCTPFRTRAPPTARWCSRPATSSSCPIAATCRTRSGWTSATASSPRSKAASTPS